MQSTHITQTQPKDLGKIERILNAAYPDLDSRALRRLLVFNFARSVPTPSDQKKAFVQDIVVDGIAPATPWKTNVPPENERSTESTNPITSVRVVR